MMLLATPVSLDAAGGMSPVAPSGAMGNPAQFQQTMAQAAPPADVTTVAPMAAPQVNATTEVSRSSGDRTSLGDRILENLSAVHQGASGPGTAPVVKSAAPGPAEQALAPSAPGGVGAPAKMPDDNFDAMMQQLQSVYSNVIQVSLVSKSTGSFSSSLNKLMSAS